MPFTSSVNPADYLTKLYLTYLCPSKIILKTFLLTFNVSLPALHILIHMFRLYYYTYYISVPNYFCGVNIRRKENNIKIGQHRVQRCENIQ